jgi:hypothetical protein
MKEKPVSVVLCYFSNVRVVRRFGFPCVLECRNDVNVWFTFSLSIFFSFTMLLWPLRPVI